MNNNLYIEDSFEIPSLNTEIETREIQGRDGFLLGDKKVKGYNFSIPFIYVNHEKKGYQDIVNEIVEHMISDDEVRLRFEGEYWHWNAIFSGTIQFKQKTQGFVSFELNCIIIDPFKHSNELYNTVSQNDHLTIYNRGTARTYPNFKVTAKKDSTMLMLSKNDEDYFMIGEPEDVFKKNVNKSSKIYQSHLNSLSGWSYINDDSVIADIYAGGSTGGVAAIENGGAVIKSLPEDVTGWLGAGLRQSLAQSVNDFDITVQLSIHTDWRSKSTGKAMTNLFDESGKLVATLGLVDASSERNVRLYVAVYDELGQRKRICDYAHPMFNASNTHTHIRLIRKGNEFQVKAWRMVSWSTYKKSDIYSTRFIDAGDLYIRPIRQIGFYLSRHSNSQTNISNPKIFYINMVRPHDSKEDEIPYVVNAGDEIEINTQHEVVIVNGEPMTELKDFGSNYFNADSGLTEVFIEPKDTYDVVAEWRDKFH